MICRRPTLVVAQWIPGGRLVISRGHLNERSHIPIVKRRFSCFDSIRLEGFWMSRHPEMAVKNAASSQNPDRLSLAVFRAISMLKEAKYETVKKYCAVDMTTARKNPRQFSFPKPWLHFNMGIELTRVSLWRCIWELTGQENDVNTPCQYHLPFEIKLHANREPLGANIRCMLLLRSRRPS